ncbi:transposable element Tcb1 transposase [Trichonephila clavipes]|nr:transposable element Tcb1 transposase [Trichonephila clavipes]
MIFNVVELLDDRNVDVPSWKYPRNLESPRVSSPGFDNDSKMMVINRRSTGSDLSRKFSSATGTTVSRQTVYRRLGRIALYARRTVRCVPLTATQCHLRLTWSREHALWTPQQRSCVMFSLSPTSPEHVWDMLGRRIAARQPPPTCLPEFRRALLDEWSNIPHDQIDNLILSMPRRCKACFASSGRHTPY